MILKQQPKVKYLFALSLLLLLSACNFDGTEMKRLQRENAKLKKQLADYENALVITPKNMHKYIGSVAYGAPEVKVNETSYMETRLQLHTLPKGFKIEWTSDPEVMFLSKFKDNEIERRFKNSWPGAAKRTFKGTYTITFPSGEKWTSPWEKEVVVK